MIAKNFQWGKKKRSYEIISFFSEKNPLWYKNSWPGCLFTTIGALSMHSMKSL